MAPLSPSHDTIILITGINGYIASNIGLLLLKQGYTVRGTSRSGSAKDRLLSRPFAPYSSHYQHAVVPDITTPGAFDAAVQGVHAIIHVASPVDFSVQTLAEFVDPAVEGVTSILNSAFTHAGPQLRTFVLTSSMSAATDPWVRPFTEPYAYTEADWNASAMRVASENFSPPAAYAASKTAAERAMWDFSEAHSSPSSLSSPPPGASFGCVSINPGVVMGPPVLLPEHPSQINLTLKPIWDIFTNATSLKGHLPAQIGGASWIDVRDVAAVHAWAATHPDEASGERFLATNGKAPPQAIADVLRQEFPDREILVGEPGKGYVDGWWWEENGFRADAAKMRRAMGTSREQLKDFRETILDTVRVLEGEWPEEAKGNIKHYEL